MRERETHTHSISCQDKILDCSKLKEFADDKSNVAQMMISLLG